MDNRNKLLTGICWLAVAGIILYQTLSAHQKIYWLSVVFLGILMMIGESLGENLHTRGSSTYGIIILFAALLSLNTASAVLVALFGAFSYQDIRMRKSLLVLAFNGAQYALAITASAFFYHLTGGAARSFTVESALKSILPLLLASIIFWAINSLIMTLATSWEYSLGFVEFLRKDALKLLPNQLIYSIVGLALGIIYAQNAFHLLDGEVVGSTAEAFRGLSAALLLLLLLGVAWYFSGKNIEILSAYDHTVNRLMKYLELREPYLNGHGERVARYAQLIASGVKMSHYDQEKLRYAALLHDLGKMAIPREILLRKGPLYEEEFEKVKQHPLVAGSWLEEIPYLAETANAVYHHHEYYDGGGYVDMISGDTIPLNARILAIADAYDAMTMPRPWRDAKSREDAIAELLENSDVQFDGELVKVFIEALESLQEKEVSPETEPIEEREEKKDAIAELLEKEKEAQVRKPRRMGSRRQRLLEERRRKREELEKKESGEFWIDEEDARKAGKTEIEQAREETLRGGETERESSLEKGGEE